MPPDGDYVPGRESASVTPSDALTLREVIDMRMKDLLNHTSDPKDLTKALEAAVKWESAKHEMGADEKWGADLRRTTTDG